MADLRDFVKSYPHIYLIDYFCACSPGVKGRFLSRTREEAYAVRPCPHCGGRLHPDYRDLKRHGLLEEAAA